MKKIIHNILIGILCIGLLDACKKGFNDQQSEFPDSQLPDLTTQATVTVTGFVTNENGEPLFNASVTAGTKSASTDIYGYFKISDVSLPKTAPLIRIQKQGYFNSYRTFVKKGSDELFTRIQMIPKTEVGSFNAISGGSITTVDGGMVSMPANAVVNANTSAVYSGTVHVAAHLFKQENANEWSATTPGDNRGINNEGFLQVRKSYGMMAVELTGDAGELLQIAPGKEATISTPIVSTLSGTAPATIPLWSFDVVKGLWKQEGSTVKNGNNYVGNVSHFSFWDGAVGVPLVNLTVQVVNNTLQPMSNVLVAIRVPGQQYGYYSMYGFTDAQGIVSGAVFANSSLTLDVLTPCNLSAYAHTFTTSNIDIDLGTIPGDFGQSIITITGTAVDCISAPLARGFLWVYNGTDRRQVPIVNGSFNYSYLGCTNSPSYFVTTDSAMQQQSQPVSFTLAPGINDLTQSIGTFQTCGAVTLTFYTITIDGVQTNYSELTDSIICLAPLDQYPAPDNEITYIGVRRPTGTDPSGVRFDGGRVAGNNHQVYSFWPEYPMFLSGVMPQTTVQVNITEYGDLGGFVSGSFSGIFLNPNSPFPYTQHTISCSFRATRIQ